MDSRKNETKVITELRAKAVPGPSGFKWKIELVARAFGKVVRRSPFPSPLFDTKDAALDYARAAADLQRAKKEAAAKVDESAKVLDDNLFTVEPTE